MTLNQIPENNTPSNDDFTEEKYRHLLLLAREKLSFVGFSEPKEPNGLVFWRHDVEASLNRSLALAEIESDLGLTSTFFFNLRSEFYNVAERAEIRRIRQLLDFGMNLGVHFDSGQYGISSADELERALKFEADVIGELVGARPIALSFHNPSAFDLTFRADSYAGLYNCYSSFFQDSARYSSDSNGYWRFASIGSALESDETTSIQVLTHPEWWQVKPMSPRARISRSAFGRAMRNLHSYDSMLADCGRPNFGSLGAQVRERLSEKPGLLEAIEVLVSCGNYEMAAKIFAMSMVPSDSGIEASLSEENSSKKNEVDEAGHAFTSEEQLLGFISRSLGSTC